MWHCEKKLTDSFDKYFLNTYNKPSSRLDDVIVAKLHSLLSRKFPSRVQEGEELTITKG